MVTIIRRVCVLSALALALTHSPLLAQTAPERQVLASFPDTSVWRPVLQFVIDELAPSRRLIANDTFATPWYMTLPSTAPPWPTVERDLRTLLRARDVLPEHVYVYNLIVDRMTLSGDTAKLQVTMGTLRRC